MSWMMMAIAAIGRSIGSGEIPKLLELASAVDLGRFVGLPRQGGKARRKNKDDERDLLPDIDEHHSPKGKARTAEPIETRVSGRFEQTVDDAKIRLQQHVPDQRHADRRHRHRNGEDGEIDRLQPHHAIEHQGDEKAQQELADHGENWNTEW